MAGGQETVALLGTKKVQMGYKGKKNSPQAQLGGGLSRELVQFPSFGTLKTQLDEALETWSELRAYPALSRRLN